MGEEEDWNGLANLDPGLLFYPHLLGKTSCSMQISFPLVSTVGHEYAFLPI